MRWKSKPHIAEYSQRVKKRFALFPCRLDDDYRVWLEKYYVKQTYYIIRNRGRWFDQETWSQSTEKTKFLDSIRNSDKNVQDTVDTS